ncbi:hypothetical protein K2X33_10625 [bacterium]|nr:hypothetical protein [bacterium]
MSRPKLYAHVVPPSKLSGPDKLRMFELMQSYYAEEDWNQFENDLAKKTDVIVMRDTQSETIRGFSTMMVFKESVDGKSFGALFSGDTIVERSYWGQRVLGRAFLFYIFKKRLRHPFQRF